jgi:hypothetical protein
MKTWPSFQRCGLWVADGGVVAADVHMSVVVWRWGRAVSIAPGSMTLRSSATARSGSGGGGGGSGAALAPPPPLPPWVPPQSRHHVAPQVPNVYVFK